eukprot:1158267-Pelagomonas_calceolata.AAC.4
MEPLCTGFMSPCLPAGELTVDRQKRKVPRWIVLPGGHPAQARRTGGFGMFIGVFRKAYGGVGAARELLTWPGEGAAVTQGLQPCRLTAGLMHAGPATSSSYGHQEWQGVGGEVSLDS